jgi:hypothetical protein
MKYLKLYEDFSDKVLDNIEDIKHIIVSFCDDIISYKLDTNYQDKLVIYSLSDKQTDQDEVESLVGRIKELNPSYEYIFLNSKIAIGLPEYLETFKEIEELEINNYTFNDDLSIDVNGDVDLYDKEGRYYSRIGQEYMLLANQEIMKDKNSMNVQNYINEAIRFSVEGKNLLKNDVSAIEALAQVYENTGIFVPDSLKLAEESYIRVLELEPKNPKINLKLGQLKRSLANNEQDEGAKKQLLKEANEYFQKSVDWKDNFDNRIYLTKKDTSVTYDYFEGNNGNGSDSYFKWKQAMNKKIIKMTV